MVERHTVWDDYIFYTIDPNTGYINKLQTGPEDCPLVRVNLLTHSVKASVHQHQHATRLTDDMAADAADARFKLSSVYSFCRNNPNGE